MEQLTTTLTTPRKSESVKKLTKNSKIYKTILHAIEEKKGENIVCLDLRKIPEAVADFFIVCEATSTTQIKAIGDYIEYYVKEVLDESPYRHEGRQTAQWVIVDYVNIVVHVMLPETRKFYRLEEMWSDAVSED